jgi:hypothetical protein
LSSPLKVTEDLEHIRMRRALHAHRRQVVGQARYSEQAELAARGAGRFMRWLWNR